MTTVTDDATTPDEEPQQEPTDPAAPPSPGDVIRALGYDPAAIQALIITPDSVVAVDVQYPEPLTRQE